MPKPKKPVLLAVIGAPHGVRGELRVKTFTHDPMALGDYGPLASVDGRAFTVKAIRPAGTVAVVRFGEVSTREAAEALTGVELFVDRSALPDDMDDEEFYHADLIGLDVRDESGAVVGAVTALHDFGGGDIVEITFRGRKGVMAPFTRAAVPEIDIAAGHIRIDTVAAGLGPDQDPPDERE